MSKSSLLKKIWSILKPVVTLGLSLAVAALAKKANDKTGIVEKTGDTIKTTIIETIDDAVNPSQSDNVEDHI